MVHQLINPQALKQFLQLLPNSLWQRSADRVFALQESKSLLSMLFLAGRHVLRIWAHLSLGLTEPHQWGAGREDSSLRVPQLRACRHSCRALLSHKCLN